MVTFEIYFDLTIGVIGWAPGEDYVILKGSKIDLL